MPAHGVFGMEILGGSGVGDVLDSKARVRYGAFCEQAGLTTELAQDALPDAEALAQFADRYPVPACEKELLNFSWIKMGHLKWRT
ncbi:MAG: hypothetical protein WC130_11110 [Kiritimatiellia bacterium]